MTLKPQMLAALLLVAGTFAWAQDPAPGGPVAGARPNDRSWAGDVRTDSFFPPELIMQNQQAIGLKEDQQKAIKAEMQKTAARFTDLQWQQSAESEKLAELAKKERVDEPAVLGQFDKLVIKREHLALLVRIKNILTPEQQAQLAELKKRGFGEHQGAPGETKRRWPRRPAGQEPGQDAPPVTP